MGGGLVTLFYLVIIHTIMVMEKCWPHCFTKMLTFYLPEFSDCWMVWSSKFDWDRAQQASVNTSLSTPCFKRIGIHFLSNSRGAGGFLPRQRFEIVEVTLLWIGSVSLHLKKNLMSDHNERIALSELSNYFVTATLFILKNKSLGPKP